jgi:hypothetical protein
MLDLRQSFAAASLCALSLVCGSSCTTDERNLALAFSSAETSDAGSGGRATEPDGPAGASGSPVNDHAAGAGGAQNPTHGGAAGYSVGGAAGAGDGGAGESNNAGSAGAAFAGPCGDIDDNAVDDCSETLAQNSRFDSNVEHWALGEWNGSNAQTKGSSGSLSVLNDSPVIAEAGFKLLAAEQCVQVTGDLEYEVAARVLIPAGQGAGFGGINLWIFANDGCQGTFVTALTSTTTAVTNVWTTVGSHFKMPTAARSMSLRLSSIRPFAQPKLQVLFDDVLLKQKSP